MGILSRMVKIFKADINGVMDQLEDQELLLRQHLREMEEVLGRRESQLKEMVLSRNKSQQDRDIYRRKREKFEQDLTLAIEKDKLSPW